MRVRITDAATGRPTPARVRLRDEEGKYYRSENRLRVGEKDLEVYYKRSLGKEDLFYSPSEFTLELPKGKYNMLVERGFEYTPFEKDFEMPAEGDEEISAALSRWIDMSGEGWMSGDYHIHFDRIKPGSSEEVLEILKAEDLKIAHLLVSQLEGKFREAQPAFGKEGSAYSEGYSVHAGEECVNDRLGHLAFIGIPHLIEPVGTGPRRRVDTQADYPCAFVQAKKAKEAGGTVFACHGGHGEFAVDLALGVIDGIEVLQGNKWFQVSRDGKEMLLAPHWYHALNCGFKIPGTAASDYFYLTHKIVNLECNYVKVGDDFTPEAWLSGLKQGRFFMTNGPMMLDFSVNSKMMGETINLKKPGERVKVSIRIRSLYPLDTLEIVRNGVIIRSIANNEKRTTWEYEEEIPVHRSCWLAARATGSHPNPLRGYLFLHGNPVYLEVAGKPILVADSCAWWLGRIDDLIGATETELIFDRPEDKEETLRIFRKGREYYEKLLARCRY